MSFKISDLLRAIDQERKKSKSQEDDGFVYLQQMNPEWQNIFNTYFLSSTTRLPQTSTSTTSDDDLIFYVTRKQPSDSQVDSSHSVEVFRHHDTKRQPTLGSPEYDWEDTIYLNLVLHQFEYTVTTAVCKKTDDRHIEVIKLLSTRVYASPSRRDMKNKGTTETITYPNLYFTVDNFEDAFCEMIIKEGQAVCVELVARNPMLNKPRVLFLGSIKYEALKKVYDARPTTSVRVAQRVTLGMFHKHRVEFVKMRGPYGKGYAEMAVSENRISSPQSGSTSSLTIGSDQSNSNRRQGVENDAPGQTTPPPTRAHNHAATSEVETHDNHREATDDTGGFLGRTFNHAMNWVRNGNLDLSSQNPPLQTCLTYLTLPCHFIVKDILESDSTPLLTAPKPK